MGILQGDTADLQDVPAENGISGPARQAPEWMPATPVRLDRRRQQKKSSEADYAVDPIDRYEKEVNRVPLLTRGEEISLGRGAVPGSQAEWSLVLSNLRFVVPIARAYAGFDQPLEDLVQEGNLGLLKAASRYSAVGRGRFIQFAERSIHNEIRSFILRNRSIINEGLSKAQQDQYFRLHKIAQRPDGSPARVRSLPSIMRRVELDRLVGDALTDQSAGPEAKELLLEHERHAQRLWKAIGALASRDSEIVHCRWLSAGKKPSLRQLARKYGLSRERIRQLEQRAFGEIRKYIDDDQTGTG